jgi:histidyl-tRNA synthetase
MIQKPSIPKGTRDFSPLEMAERNYIFDTIRSVFKKYGYAPLETPSMENLSTLLGKYGDEGDKLLFKILNSGEAFANVQQNELSNSNALSLKVCEKGLRYDLTVPFARYVVQHQNELSFPFKRYQIQPVWRADRPQKGRYREFYQCDVDVIGSKSLINELELVQITDEVFSKFGINVCIKINNRKVLQGLAEVIGHPDKLIDITVAIDKIDKIGIDAVKEELTERGIDNQGLSIIEPILLLKGTTEEKIATMRKILSGDTTISKSSDIGLKGIDELEELFSLIKTAGIGQEVEIDLSLARGLNYYTGAIFEVKAKDYVIGSICGGGRYDDLTGIFGLPGMSGVGISFGADRIYDVLKGLDKFPKNAIEGTKILFANMGQNETLYIIPIVKELRAKGVNCEIYPDSTKLKNSSTMHLKRISNSLQSPEWTK